ncbi:MAG: hypothetical protein A2Y80_00465 [Deltaproteobacteria bacterium RBG_13_58_19]|nr:MAG: hypothetical protein A2Y80_00465 [Deltaproteobacteria bacterium RBG_13_58_19]
MGHPGFKLVALCLVILFPLMAIPEVATPSSGGCQCGMSQCANCCHHHGPAAKTCMSSCLCPCLTCMSGAALDQKLWPSTSLFLARSKPFLKLFVPAIFHPPEIDTQVSS